MTVKSSGCVKPLWNCSCFDFSPQTVIKAWQIASIIWKLCLSSSGFFMWSWCAQGFYASVYIHIVKKGVLMDIRCTQMKKVYPNKISIPKWKRYTQMKKVYIPKWKMYTPKWELCSQMKFLPNLANSRVILTLISPHILDMDIYIYIQTYIQSPHLSLKSTCTDWRVTCML